MIPWISGSRLSRRSVAAARPRSRRRAGRPARSGSRRRRTPCAWSRRRCERPGRRPPGRRPGPGSRPRSESARTRSATSERIWSAIAFPSRMRAVTVRNPTVRRAAVSAGNGACPSARRPCRAPRPPPATSSSPFEPPGWITAVHAGVGRHLERVREREERVARHAPRPSRDRPPCAPRSTTSPRATSARRRCPRWRASFTNTIVFDFTRHEIVHASSRSAHSCVGRLAAARRPSSPRGVSVTTSRSWTSAPPGSGRTSSPAPRPERRRHHAEVRPLGERGERRRRERRRHHDLGEDLGHGRGGVGVAPPVERDDPPERGHRRRTRTPRGTTRRASPGRRRRTGCCA